MVRDQSDVLSILARELPRLASYGVVHLSLFGSFARGEQRDDSDVDVLVEFSKPPKFRDWLDVRDHLAQALGRPVDLVMTTAVQPRMRKVLDREALRVA